MKIHSTSIALLSYWIFTLTCSIIAHFLLSLSPESKWSGGLCFLLKHSKWNHLGAESLLPRSQYEKLSFNCPTPVLTCSKLGFAKLENCCGLDSCNVFSYSICWTGRDWGDLSDRNPALHTCELHGMSECEIRHLPLILLWVLQQIWTWSDKASVLCFAIFTYWLYKSSLKYSVFLWAENGRCKDT